MKQLLGSLLIFSGFFVALYFGLWWAFIGGIIEVTQQIRAPHLDAVALGLGIARILFASLIGWVSGLAFILPGLAILASDP